MNDSFSPSGSGKRTLVLILLPLLAIALAVLVIYANRHARDKGVVTVVVSGESAATADINTGKIIDATGRDPLVPEVGYRYKVFVDDESDDRSSGIAKIGGRATFIPGARRGQPEGGIGPIPFDVIIYFF